MCVLKYNAYLMFFYSSSGSLDFLLIVEQHVYEDNVLLSVPYFMIIHCYRNIQSKPAHFTCSALVLIVKTPNVLPAGILMLRRLCTFKYYNVVSYYFRVV